LTPVTGIKGLGKNLLIFAAHSLLWQGVAPKRKGLGNKKLLSFPKHDSLKY
jgi:hypothetical protein